MTLPMVLLRWTATLSGPLSPMYSCPRGVWTPQKPVPWVHLCDLQSRQACPCVPAAPRWERPAVPCPASVTWPRPSLVMRPGPLASRLVALRRAACGAQTAGMAWGPERAVPLTFWGVWGPTEGMLEVFSFLRVPQPVSAVQCTSGQSTDQWLRLVRHVSGPVNSSLPLARQPSQAELRCSWSASQLHSCHAQCHEQHQVMRVERRQGSFCTYLYRHLACTCCLLSRRLHVQVKYLYKYAQ